MPQILDRIVELTLFVAPRVLLSPKFQEQRWHGGQYCFCSMDLGVATGTE